MTHSTNCTNLSYLKEKYTCTPNMYMYMGYWIISPSRMTDKAKRDTFHYDYNITYCNSVEKDNIEVTDESDTFDTSVCSSAPAEA